MDDVIGRLDERVTRAAARLRNLADQRVRLTAEIATLQARLAALEESRDPAGLDAPFAASEQAAVRAGLREALAALPRLPPAAVEEPR